MQKTHFPVQTGKLPKLMGGNIEPRTETCVNWFGPITMVPCLHHRNIYIQRDIWIWREQKCIPLVGGENPLTCAGQQTTPSHGGRYRAENGDLRKFGSTYRHGTVLAPRQCLHQKEAMCMESTEMYSTSWCNNPTYLCWPANYPISWGAV